MSNVFLIRKAAVIFKDIGRWLFLKRMRIIAESIKMNKARASWKMICGGLQFGSLWDVSESIRLATKKKLYKTGERVTNFYSRLSNCTYLQSIKPVAFIYINIFQGSNFSKRYHALNTVFRSFHSYAEISHIFYKINHDGQSFQALT